ncbi:cupredoxin domain-containing protein [Chelativorans intermedius]|uniref:Cupredoxin family protein n=1 Tax=Chelativorans intermedius TaxID=515947 RepID=A0ABV6DBG0_9HYPH|nr:cupredoxin family protein [Chelativorans intermedius]MCT9000263.1 cupredoxin family protein [Chelativorans intermedius]
MMKISTHNLPIAAAFGASLLVQASVAWADAGHGTVSFGKPGSAAEVDRTIELTADGMSYGIDSLQVRAGETIRFVIENGGELNHDFTIGDQATQAEHRAKMKEMMASSSRMMDHDDANAVFLKPGETGELIWTFSKTGRFEFACNVPGHYEAGMHGPITVAEADVDT